ncbi:hypothetical protein ACOTH1_03895 [Achromobacter ruhlandii]|uniref:hypothetical protein n=1 Tax=Achromobacter ruhlandii TaxID=72557 RepID=UPI003B9CBB5F
MVIGRKRAKRNRLIGLIGDGQLQAVFLAVGILQIDRLIQKIGTLTALWQERHRRA